MSQTPEYSLMHYGILGMKWGRRKDGKPQGFQYGKGSKNSRVVSPEHARKKKLKKKHVSEMSNAELRELNERMQLEVTYAQLTSKDLSPGKAAAKNILASAKKASEIYNLVNSPMVKAGLETYKKMT